MRKSKGKNPKKWSLIVPIILLIINVVVISFPVAYIGFIRYTNSTNREPVVYAKSGKMLYWPIKKYESAKDWFEMDGVKYIRFSGEIFSLEHSDDKLGEPVANIKNNPAENSALNRFVTWLLTGSTIDEINTSTIYPIINDNGFEFYKIINDVYCPEEKFDLIKTYYEDIANYELQNVVSKNSVYSSKDSAKRGDTPYINIKKEIILSPNTFDELHQMYNYDQNFEYVEIPDKYKEIDKAAVVGTPISGYDERSLYAYSNDKIAYIYIVLVLIENQVYVEKEASYDYIRGCPLPDEMNQYIIETVFID